MSDFYKNTPETINNGLKPQSVLKNNSQIRDMLAAAEYLVFEFESAVTQSTF